MKYLLCLVFNCLALIASAQTSTVNVVTSASIFKDMAQNIGGDLVTVQSIVPIGGDPHLYEPKPSDATLIKNAEIILVNGLTFEGWINDVIDNSGTSATMATITEGADIIESDTYKNAPDPHAWMDASNGLIYIENIKNTLIAYDPENKAVYEKNHEKYAKEIKALNTYIQNEISKIPEDYRMIVTSHDAFAYYGRKYNLKLNALKGISTEAETQTSDMVRVSKAIRESGVPAIFIESTINPKVIQQIARDNGVKIGGELFADSLGEEEGEAGTYIKMLKHNTDVIVKALSSDEVTTTKIDGDDKSNSWLIYLIAGVLLLGLMAFIISKFKS